MRLSWLALGCVCLVLGAAGVLLPLVPTTPFLLLAAFAFAKSSERLHLWLVEHPVFGPPIIDWKERRAISRRAKTVAMVSLACSIAPAFIVDVPKTVLLVQMVSIAGVAAFILTRRES